VMAVDLKFRLERLAMVEQLVKDPQALEQRVDVKKCPC
jgi:hypothetical protein